MKSSESSFTRLFLTRTLRLLVPFILAFGRPAPAANWSGIDEQKLLVSLQNRDFDTAAGLIAASEYNETIKSALIKEIRSLADIPRLLAQGFRENEGKTETVDMIDGPRTVEILGVGTVKVAARENEAAPTVFVFGIDDLSDREAFKRLARSGGEKSQVKIGCGLLALKAGKIDVALSCFETSGSSLGRMLGNQVKKSGGDIAVVEEPVGMKPLTEEAFAEVIGQLRRANPLQGGWRPSFQISNDRVYVSLDNHSNLKDLSPLRNYQIYALSLRSTAVESLAPILNDTLMELDIRQCPIASLVSLRGMKLTRLAASTVEPVDVLHSLNVTRLDIADSPVSKLDFLRGMALRELNISGCDVQDISELRHVKGTLETLTFTPRGFNDMNFIRQLTELKHLHMYNGKINEMRSLRSLNLESLTVSGKDMWVTSFDSLAHMPLKRLYLNCGGLRDLRPLLRLRSLESLAVPKGVGGLTVLRDHPGLKKIALIRPGEPDNWQDVEMFWRVIDTAK
ncbi:MAG: hypothetical protein RRC34_04765 [Lentisphaeria bacterium]|nr:hypothetical protein [Lentisphaeria bacterium]